MTSLFCLGVVFIVSGCSEKFGFVQTQFSGATMGTQYHVSIVTDHPLVIGTEIAEKIEEKLNEVNQSMSTYISDSEISTINQSRSIESIAISDELYEVLFKAQEISRLSNGAFDITIAPLVNLWGFGPELRENNYPDEDELARRLDLVGFEKLVLVSNPKSLSKTPELQLDLSAIAKGYGSDSVAAVLDAFGFTNYMIEIGGEIVVKGHSARGTPWRIGIETPSPNGTGIQQAINISNVGVATSGDYRNYFEKDGQRFSHTINPKTGKPITHKLASVTVIGDNATDADGYATAINVLGYEAGKQFAEQNELAVYFIRKKNGDFVSDYTEQFKQYLSINE